MYRRKRTEALRGHEKHFLSNPYVNSDPSHKTPPARRRGELDRYASSRGASSRGANHAYINHFNDNVDMAERYGRPILVGHSVTRAVTRNTEQPMHTGRDGLKNNDFFDYSPMPEASYRAPNPGTSNYRFEARPPAEYTPGHHSREARTVRAKAQVICPNVLEV